MNRTYPFLHWLLTLVTAPFFSEVIILLFGKNPHTVVTLLEVYPITIVVSFIYSIPVFVVYFICYLLFKKMKLHWLTTKFIMIGITAAGIFITTYLTGGTLMNEVNAAYLNSALIMGLLVPIKQSITHPPELEFANPEAYTQDH